MTTLLDQPLHTFVEAHGERVPPQAEAFVARIAGLAYEVAATAPPAALARALASGSPTALLREVAALVLARGVSSPESEARLRGELAIAEALERTGGLWRADEAQAALGVSRAALHAWRAANRVLALPLADGSFGYPVAQFVRPASDATPPRPHPALAAVLTAAGSLTAHELFGVLATPQPALAPDDAADAEVAARTGFDALHAGDAERVVALLTHLTARDEPDAVAPPAAPRTARAARAAA